MSGLPAGENLGASPKPEVIKKIKQPSRQEVEGALKFAIGSIKRQKDPYEINGQRRTNLDKNEEKLFERYEEVTEDRREMESKTKEKIEWLDNGEKKSTNEWMPIDEVLGHMHSEIKNLERIEKNPALRRNRDLDKAILADYRKNLEIIESASIPLGEVRDPRLIEETQQDPRQQLTKLKELVEQMKEKKGHKVLLLPSETSPSQPKSQSAEDFDFSQPEGTGFAAERFFEDDRRNPVATVTELEEARRNKYEGKRYAHQKIVDQMDNVEKLLDDPQVQGHLARNEDETPEAYKRRLLRNLRARLTLHGKFEDSQDQLYGWMKENLKDANGKTIPSGRWDEILIGAEALEAVNINAANAAKQGEYEQRMHSFNQRGDRRRPAYGVDLGAEHQYATAALMQDKYTRIDADGRVVKERAAEVDLVAFELVSQVLMDVQDAKNPALGKHADGRPKTYGEALRSLKQDRDALISEEYKLKKQNQKLSPEKQQQLDELSKQLLNLRESFYHDVIDVLEKRQQHNPFNDRDSFRFKAFEKLYGQGEGNLDLASKSPGQAAQTLTDYYKRVNGERFPTNPTPDQQNRIDRIQRRFDLLTATSPDIFQLALKGADLMKRRIEALPEKPKLEKVANRIYRKTFVDKGFYRGSADLGEAASDLTVPAIDKNEHSGGGKGRKDGGRDIPPVPTGNDGEPIPGVPAVEPGGEKNGEKPFPEVPEGVEPEPELKDKPEPTPKPDGETSEAAALVKLRTRDNFAAAGLKDRRAQNVLQGAQHEIAHNLDNSSKSRWYRFKDRIFGGMYKIPVVGGVVRSMVHPIEQIWQNSIAKGVFDQQRIRFVSDLQDVLKSQSDSTIPIDISPELQDKAKSGGRDLFDQQNGLRKLIWNFSDFGKGILGIGQTSEQIFAKKWLQEEVKKAPDVRDPELTDIFKSSLSEQTKLGDTFALYDKNSGLTFAEASRLAISAKAGDRRHLLENAEKAKQVSDHLKSYIAKYANGNLTEEQLVAEVNKYLVGDFQKNLTKEQQEEFKAPEVASNILSLARYVTGKNELTGEIVEANRWERYQNERAESGITMWDEYQIENVIFGKSEWGGVRGKVEAGFLNERLTRSLAERPRLWNKSGAGAIAMAKDVISNGAFFLAGYVTSGAVFGASIPVRVAAGLAGVSGLAALKETGIGLSGLGIKGIKGRYVKEVEQLSREIARGRVDVPGSKIREEMKKALVLEQMKDATSMAESIENIANLEILSPEDAKKLLFAMADADARMNLTDLSGKREVNFKVQNFISYHQGQENAEHARLRGALYNGAIKLRAANIPTASVYDLHKYSAVAAAQLRFSSDDLARIKQWVNHNDPKIKYDEIEKMVGELNLGVKRSESLRAKEATLWKLTVKRGVSTAIKAALTGVAAPIVYHAPLAVAEGVVGEIADIRQEGFAEWQHEWGELITKGNVPLEVDSSGQLRADLPPLEQGVLWARNVIVPPIPSPAHTEVIDNVYVTLPGDLNVATLDKDGNHYDGLVDRRTGQVFDMSHFKFGMQDWNNDGVQDLVILDQNGNLAGEASTVLTNLGLDGVKISKGEDIVERTEVGDLGRKGPDTGPNVETIPGVNGNEIWKEAENYRVVHASAESDAVAMNDVVFKTDNVDHPLGIKITFPDNMVHNPNTGANEPLMDAASDGRVGVLMEIPNYGPNGENVSVYVPAYYDSTISRFVVDLDPTDTETMVQLPQGGSVTMAAFAQNILNEQKLNELGEGFQGSELSVDTRSIFNLANPDGLMEHQGRIHAGYWDPMSSASKWGFAHGPGMSEGSFMAVHSIHGSGPVDLAEAPVTEPVGPEIPTEPEYTETITPTFVVEYQSPVEDFHLIYTPLPARENIEKSVHPKNLQQASSTVTPPAQTPPDLSEQERQRLIEEKTQKENRIRELEEEAKTRALENEEKEELERLKKEVNEADLKINPPAKEDEVIDEGILIDLKKEDYMNLKENIKAILSTKDIDLINDRFDLIGIPHINKDVLDEIDKKPELIDNTARNLIVLGLQQQIPDAVRRKYKEEYQRIYDQAKSQLSPENQKKLEHIEKKGEEIKNYQEEQAQNQTDIPRVIEIQNKIDKANEDIGTYLQNEKEFATEYTKMGQNIQEEFFTKYEKKMNDEFTRLAKLIESWKSSLEPPRTDEKNIAEKVKIINREVFERAGQRSKEEMEQLIDAVAEIHIKAIEQGNGKLAKTIPENEKLGFTEIVNDGFITYIPKAAGELVVVGDLHGDFAAFQKIIDKNKFIEDMESGASGKVIVFEGDYLDRGEKDIELMEGLLELKRRYPKNVIIMKADHETKKGRLAEKDQTYFKKVAAHYGDESIFDKLNNDLFGNMPRAVFAGNGVVMVHGGPVFYDFNLRELADLRDSGYSSATAVFDGIMTWGDPQPMTETKLAEHQATAAIWIEEINRALAKANVASDKLTDFHGEPYHANNLEALKKRFESAAKNGFWFNTDRVHVKGRKADIVDAALSNIVIYSEKGLENFLNNVGGKVLVRGHQVTSDMEGGPNPFSKNIMWTIHSTGKGSPDSYYQSRELHPSYAVFDRNENIDSINSSKHIIPVWN